MAKLLTKDELLRPPLPTETVEDEGLGGAVRIRALNAHQHSEYQRLLYSIERDADGTVTTGVNVDGIRMRDIRLCAMGIVDEDDEPFLSEDEAGRLPHGSVSRIAERIRKLSGLERAPEEEQEDAEGN